MSLLNLEDVFLELREALGTYTKRYSWREVHTAYLGNGETPPVVVVPPTERIAPGAMYCHKFNRDNKEVFQVLNTYAGITFDNNNAGMPVKVGYPEGEDVLQIKTAGGEALAFTGGSLPTQTQTAELKAVTFDRLQELKLIEGTTLTPDLTGGKWRSGNTIVTWTLGATTDLTSYVPSTSGNAVWVLMSMNEAGGFTITSGIEFVAAAQGNTYDRVPKHVPDEELQIAWVKLTNGMTTITNSEIINIQGIPSIGTSAQNIVTSGGATVTSGGSIVTSG